MSLFIFVILYISFFNGIISAPVSSNDNDGMNDLAADTIDLIPYGNKLFGYPLASSGDAARKWDPVTSNVNPEETGDYFEGDILFPLGASRNGRKSETYRWSSATVPYIIAENFTDAERETIMAAINDYHSLTCIKFVPRTTESDYIVFVHNNTGCWSSVGRLGGPQVVNLQKQGCLYGKGTAIHELYHALGFFHEQSRHDRDDYVTINFTNIITGKESNFIKYGLDTTDPFGTKYDYGSIMHYTKNAFSANGMPTIISKVPTEVFGQRLGLSATDIEKLKNMYKCPTEFWLITFLKKLFGIK